MLAKKNTTQCRGHTLTVSYPEEGENEFSKLYDREIKKLQQISTPIHQSILHIKTINKLDIDTIHPKHSTSDRKNFHQIQSRSLCKVASNPIKNTLFKFCNRDFPKPFPICKF